MLFYPFNSYSSVDLFVLFLHHKASCSLRALFSLYRSLRFSCFRKNNHDTKIKKNNFKNIKFNWKLNSHHREKTWEATTGRTGSLFGLFSALGSAWCHRVNSPYMVISGTEATPLCWSKFLLMGGISRFIYLLFRKHVSVKTKESVDTKASGDASTPMLDFDIKVSVFLVHM